VRLRRSTATRSGQSSSSVGRPCHRRQLKEAGEKADQVRAERGYVDEVIEPSLRCAKLIAGLRLLENKRDTNPRKKHGNIPL
jgi:acetyl-CoA carboxylase carboxyltransferase component